MMKRKKKGNRTVSPAAWLQRLTLVLGSASSISTTCDHIVHIDNCLMMPAWWLSSTIAMLSLCASSIATTCDRVVNGAMMMSAVWLLSKIAWWLSLSFSFIVIVIIFAIVYDIVLVITMMMFYRVYCLIPGFLLWWWPSSNQWCHPYKGRVWQSENFLLLYLNRFEEKDGKKF